MVTLVFIVALAQVFEEAPTDSLALRERLFRQMDAHALRVTLEKDLGYGATGVKAAGVPLLQKIGEDVLAVYHRCWIPLGDSLEQYGLYLVPKGLPRGAKRPLVIAQHGGGGTPEMALFKGGSNYHDMIRGAVREGYIVWAPLVTMYPFGDRDQGTAIPADVRANLDARFRAAGTSLIGVELARLSRGLDALLAARAEIDATRIGMVGLSYGGFYAMYAAALDPRIRVVVASCSFLNERRKTESGRPEGLPVELSGPEMAALVWPRPLQVQSGVKDKLLPIDSARAAAGRVKPLYAASPDKFEFHAFDGGHEWRGDIAWPFLRSHLAKR